MAKAAIKTSSTTPKPKATPVGPRDTNCECISPSREYDAGSTCTRWGHKWKVDKTGRRMTGIIPAYDVENGIAAGRWKPVGMSGGEANLIYWRAQFAAVKGNQPDPNLTAEMLETDVKRELARQGAYNKALRV